MRRAPGWLIKWAKDSRFQLRSQLNCEFESCIAHLKTETKPKKQLWALDKYCLIASSSCNHLCLHNTEWVPSLMHLYWYISFHFKLFHMFIWIEESILSEILHPTLFLVSHYNIVKIYLYNVVTNLTNTYISTLDSFFLCWKTSSLMLDESHVAFEIKC